MIITGSGNQTEPSIDGQYVVYSGPAASASDGLDVFVYDLTLRTTTPVAFGPGDQDSPDTYGTVVVYRTAPGIGITSAGIGIRNWKLESDSRLPGGSRDAGGTGHPTIGSAVAAWEHGAADRDIVLKRLDDGLEFGLGPNGAMEVAGDQHSPSARGSVVAWVDEADSAAAWWIDVAVPGSAARIGPELVSPSGVALGDYRGNLVVAVAHSEPGVHDADIEVWGRAGSGTPGNVEMAALHVPGVQRNPHVSSDWVAFEDMSTGHSQVVLWRWVEGPNGTLFVPKTSTGDQILNDLYVDPFPEDPGVVGVGHVRAVFADDSLGDFDISLYDLLVSRELPGGGAQSDWPPGIPPPPPPAGAASCDDIAGSTVLATLTLTREGQKPTASGQPFAVPPTDDGVMPVLVCIQAKGVSAGWVTVDEQAVARPSDFNPAVTELSIPHAVHGSSAQISGVIAGKPGATLTAYVLADPTRGSAASGTGAAHRLPASAFGCASGGDFTAVSLAALAALAALVRRRRA